MQIIAFVSTNAKTHRGSQRQSLADALRDYFKAQPGGQQAASEDMGIPYGTLRKELSQNSFREEDLDAICRKTGWAKDRDQLVGLFSFQILAGRRDLRKAESSLRPKQISLPAFFNYSALRQEKMLRSHIVKPATDEVPRLFQGLQDGDSLFLTVFDEAPLHWEGAESDKSLPDVRSAIIKGTVICYLHPSDSLYQQLKGFGSVALEPSVVRVKFEDFKERLEEHFPEDKRHLVRKQIVCVEYEWPVTCVPNFRFALYHHKPSTVGHPPMFWATVTVPFQSSRKNSEHQAGSVILESNKTFANFLHGFCYKAVKEARKKHSRDGVLETIFHRLNPAAKT